MGVGTASMGLVRGQRSHARGFALYDPRHEEYDCESFKSSCRCSTALTSQILESTNSLVSLLTEVSEPVYLLGLLRASLDRYISSRSSEHDVSANGSETDPSKGKARASGYLFGLNAIGMCILRLPAAVVEVEAPKLTGPVMQVSLRFPV